VTDPVKVQETLNNYERDLAAKDQALQLVREDSIEQFVNGLATGESPKILASAIDSLIAFGKSLNDAQLPAWKASYDAAPAVPLLAKQGATQGTEGQHSTADAQQQADDAKKTTPTQLDTDKATIIELRRGGAMSAEAIKKTGAYRRILAVEPNFSV